MALAYPYLYGKALDSIQEIPSDIKCLVVDDLIDIGDDIKEGINTVDSARYLLSLSRQKSRQPSVLPDTQRKAPRTHFIPKGPP